MLGFNLKIETCNAAFHKSPTDEIARILRDLADKIEQGRDPIVRDVNGNSCGEIEWIL